MSVLEATGLFVERASLPVVLDASLVAEAGRITVVLGANGAGKTTLLESLSGVVRSSRGTIVFDGARIEARAPSRRARLGLAHVEQGRAIFRSLTVDENLRVTGRARGTNEAYSLFPELVARRGVRSELLSGGEQQMLVVARALLARPKVLLIDEMSLGLAPLVVRRLMSTVRELADAGLAVVLVEQFAALALAIGDRAYVLRRGRIVYGGEARDLRGAPDHLHALYLGEERTSDG